MRYKAISFEGVFHQIMPCADDYTPAEDERVFDSQEEALAFPIPCKWNEDTQAWEFSTVPEALNPPARPSEDVPPSDHEVINTLLGVMG